MRPKVILEYIERMSRGTKSYERLVSAYTAATLSDTAQQFEKGLIYIKEACPNIGKGTNTIGQDFEPVIRKVFPMFKEPFHFVDASVKGQIIYNPVPPWLYVTTKRFDLCGKFTVHTKHDGTSYYMTFDRPDRPLVYYMKGEYMEVFVHTSKVRFLKTIDDEIVYVTEGGTLRKGGIGKCQVIAVMLESLSAAEADRHSDLILSASNPQKSYRKAVEMWPFKAYPFPQVTCTPERLVINLSSCKLKYTIVDGKLVRQ